MALPPATNDLIHIASRPQLPALWHGAFEHFLIAISKGSKRQARRACNPNPSPIRTHPAEPFEIPRRLIG
ncbi:hypothetical protein MES5069_490058 [Mesorhizobium escarrei]|uniref:Uncharacterized protein n=1 Tax=Mesorhizobium escarrei TaxID=666018 RepID=A0ABN8K675_9HYPH|nr:hypothetical protein MES5069_490058 [Mesorhizobium escarrei]